MAKWLKVWLIAVLAFNAAAAIVDGRRCSIRGESGCVTACGACDACGASQAPPRCETAAQVCKEVCGEGESCPDWACLLCRCDDRVPPTRDQIPSQPKHPAPGKPALIERVVWRESLSPQGPTVVPRLAISPPARLAVLCIWRL